MGNFYGNFDGVQFSLYVLDLETTPYLRDSNLSVFV